MYMTNSIKKVWEPGMILNRPIPIREPSTYIADIKWQGILQSKRILETQKTHNTKGINIFSHQYNHSFLSTHVDIPSVSTANSSTASSAETYLRY